MVSLAPRGMGCFRGPSQSSNLAVRVTPTFIPGCGICRRYCQGLHHFCAEHHGASLGIVGRFDQRIVDRAVGVGEASERASVDHTGSYYKVQRMRIEQW